MGGSTSTEDTNQQNTEDNSSFFGTLSDAMHLGQSMKCTWSSDDGSGTTYIKGDNVRTESTTDGITGYVIGTNDCTYIWEKGSSEGMMLCDTGSFAEDLEDDSDSSEWLDDNGDDTYFENEMDTDVECHAEIINDSLFTPPSEINFIDPLSSFMNF